MAKKKNQTVFLLNLISVVLVLVAIGMLFVPHVQYGTNNPTLFKGMDLVFGYTSKDTMNLLITTITSETVLFKFSFLNLLPYILMVCGVVLTLLSNSIKNKKLISCVCTLLYLASLVLLLFEIKFAVINTQLVMGSTIELVDRESLKLTYGAIIAMVCLGVSALANLYRLTLKK